MAFAPTTALESVEGRGLPDDEFKAWRGKAIAHPWAAILEEELVQAGAWKVQGPKAVPPEAALHVQFSHCSFVWQ